MLRRLASAADIPKLNALAFAAKAHWGYAEGQLEAWRPELEVKAELLEVRPVFVAEQSGQFAGFIQLATDVVPWEVWGMWVHPSHMGRGIGKALLIQAMRYASAANQDELAIDSDPHAEGFYLSCGARHVGHVAAPIEGDPQRVRPQLRVSTRAT